MAILADGGAIALLLAVSFVPPILLAVRLRAAERTRREPWRALLRAFLWGALGATLLSLLLSWLLHVPPFPFPMAGALWTAVVVAPAVEEWAKALGLRWLRDGDPEPEDGLIHGAAAGLGFAATENVLYIATAYAIGGFAGGVATALLRTLATVSLHGAATALAGYGVWRVRAGVGRSSLPHLGGAIALHAAYNLLAGIALPLATLGAIALALVAYARVVRRIRLLDRAAAAS